MKTMLNHSLIDNFTIVYYITIVIYLCKIALQNAWINFANVRSSMSV
jgi:hypothetical protein